jgi:hypothetical protein
MTMAEPERQTVSEQGVGNKEKRNNRQRFSGRSPCALNDERGQNDAGDNIGLFWNETRIAMPYQLK